MATLNFITLLLEQVEVLLVGSCLVLEEVVLELEGVSLEGKTSHLVGEEEGVVLLVGYHCLVDHLAKSGLSEGKSHLVLRHLRNQLSTTAFLV